MSARRRAISYVVARVNALDDAVSAAGFRSHSAFQRSLHRWPDAPAARSTVMNLWLGNVMAIEQAEVVALALGVHVGDIFELSNGRRIK